MTEALEKIGELKGAVDALKSTMDTMKGYLERDATARTNNHSNLIERVTRIEVGQQNLKEVTEKYQVTCTTDRQDIEKRVYKVEKKQGYQSGVAAGIALMVSAAAWVGDKLLLKG